MPEPTKPQDLVAQYELDDSRFDPDLDLPPEAPLPPPSVGSPAPAATSPPAGAPPTVTIRDPQTGRFVKPAPPEHPRGLVRLAKDLGLSEEDIAGTPSEQLHDTVYHLNNQRLQWQRERAAERYTGATEPRPAAPGPTDATTGPAGPAAAPAAPATLGITDAAYDPKIVQMAQLVEGLAGQVQQLTGALNSIQQFHQGQARATLAQQCDAWFGQKEARYGKGQGQNLDPATASYQRRVAILGLASRDNSADPIDKKLAKADATLYGAQAETPAEPDDDRPTVQDWTNGTLARPTNRVGKEPKGVNRAARAVATKLREQNLNLEDYDGSEEAGLPD